MSKIEMLVFGGIAAGLVSWYLYSTRDERRKKQENDKLEMQRRVLGIKPGNGRYLDFHSSASVARKRCSRGVCTTPGASCPRECVEAPRVKRTADGLLVHDYGNVAVTFDSSGDILEVKVNGCIWS